MVGKRRLGSERGALNTEHSIILLIAVGCLVSISDARFAMQDSLEDAAYAMQGNYAMMAKNGGPGGGEAGEQRDDNTRWQAKPGGSEEIRPDPYPTKDPDTTSRGGATYY